MSDTAIFIVGTFTFLLLSGGLFFTFLEIRRIDAETTARRQLNKARVPASLAD